MSETLAEHEFVNELGNRIRVALRKAKNDRVTIVIKTIKAKYNSSSENTVTRQEASELQKIITKGLAVVSDTEFEDKFGRLDSMVTPRRVAMSEKLPSERLLASWKCHKVVKAGKITAVKLGAMGDPHSHNIVMVEGADGAALQIEMPASAFARGVPVIGDFVVRYEDGYLSWSPKAAFEEGYSRL